MKIEIFQRDGQVGSSAISLVILMSRLNIIKNKKMSIGEAIGV
jgi:hypothetical protein